MQGFMYQQKLVGLSISKVADSERKNNEAAREERLETNVDFKPPCNTTGRILRCFRVVARVCKVLPIHRYARIFVKKVGKLQVGTISGQYREDQLVQHVSQRCKSAREKEKSTNASGAADPRAKITVPMMHVTP